MKRIFIVALCVALAVCALAVPASASTYAERWTNVLDYATVNNSDSNYFAVDHNESISLALPGNTIVSDIDLLFRSSTSVSGIVLELDESRTFNLIVESLGSNIYRAYGSANNYGFEDLSFRFKLSNTSGRGYCELLQCRISSQSVDLFNISASITRASNVSGSSSHSAGGTSNFTFSSAGDWFVSYKFADWKKFDFINFSFISNGVIIGSVSAKIGSRVVPVNITSFNGADGEDFEKAYTGYLDLYGIEHDQSNSLELFITGTCSTAIGATVSVGFINGSVIAESPSFFAIIWNAIKDGFNSVVNAISNAFGGLADEQEQTNDILDDALNQSKPDIKPEGSDVVDSVVDAESNLESNLHIDDSANDYVILVDDAVITLWNHVAGFVLVSELLTMFVETSFINDIIRVSAALGLVSFVTNLIQTIISRSGKGSSSGKQGGKDND